MQPIKHGVVAILPLLLMACTSTTSDEAPPYLAEVIAEASRCETVRATDRKLRSIQQQAVEMIRARVGVPVEERMFSLQEGRKNPEAGIRAADPGFELSTPVEDFPVRLFQTAVLEGLHGASLSGIIPCLSAVLDDLDGVPANVSWRKATPGLPPAVRLSLFLASLFKDKSGTVRERTERIFDIGLKGLTVAAGVTAIDDGGFSRGVTHREFRAFQAAMGQDAKFSELVQKSRYLTMVRQEAIAKGCEHLSRVRVLKQWRVR